MHHLTKVDSLLKSELWRPVFLQWQQCIPEGNEAKIAWSLALFQSKQIDKSQCVKSTEWFEPTFWSMLNQKSYNMHRFFSHYWTILGTFIQGKEPEVELLPYLNNTKITAGFFRKLKKSNPTIVSKLWATTTSVYYVLPTGNTSMR